jgi:hypothetical protein
VELLHFDQTGIELCGLAKKWLERLARDIATPHQGDVRVPRAELRLEAGSERRFLDPLMDLKQVWMSRADADPSNFGRTFRRERAGPNNWQKKGMKLDRLQLVAQHRLDNGFDIAKEGNRKMKLIASSPADAFYVGI